MEWVAHGPATVRRSSQRGRPERAPNGELGAGLRRLCAVLATHAYLLTQASNASTLRRGQEQEEEERR